MGLICARNAMRKFTLSKRREEGEETGVLINRVRCKKCKKVQNKSTRTPRIPDFRFMVPSFSSMLIHRKMISRKRLSLTLTCQVSGREQAKTKGMKDIGLKVP